MAKNQIEFYSYITPDGKVYNLHDLQSRYTLTIEGTGMPEIDYISQRGPYQHGETYLDYRLRPRTIQMTFRSEGASRAAHWRQRNDLLDFLRPNRQFQGRLLMGRLRIVYLDENQDYEYRDISCFIQRGPEFSAHGDTWDEWAITETLRFICPDPTFFNPGQVCYTWPFAELINRLIFPETWPLVFGQGLIDENITITYDGTWRAFPAIVFTGPVNGPTITNVSTGKKIKLNYDVSAGEKVYISLSYGRKTVISSNGANLIGTVSSDSDFTDFAIEPDPTVPNGENVINLLATNINPAPDPLPDPVIEQYSAVEIAYYTRYIGI